MEGIKSKLLRFLWKMIAFFNSSIGIKLKWFSVYCRFLFWQMKYLHFLFKRRNFNFYGRFIFWQIFSVHLYFIQGHMTERWGHALGMWLINKKNKMSGKDTLSAWCEDILLCWGHAHNMSRTFPTKLVGGCKVVVKIISIMENILNF